MNNLETCESRLKSIIMIDKQETPQKINRLLKSEILFLLKNYFDITSEDLNLDISINEDGRYSINICGECSNIKIAHIFNS